MGSPVGHAAAHASTRRQILRKTSTSDPSGPARDVRGGGRGFDRCSERWRFGRMTPASPTPPSPARTTPTRMTRARPSTPALPSRPRAAADGAPCAPPTPASLDASCTGVGAMSTAPVIDGVLDCGIPLWPMPVVVTAGPGVIPSGVQARIAAAWRPDGLYLFVRVTGAGATRTPAPTGDPAWCGDATRALRRPRRRLSGRARPTTTIRAPFSSSRSLRRARPSPRAWGRCSATRAIWVPGRASSSALRRATASLPEAFVAAADLGLTTWSLSAGGTIGLDVLDRHLSSPRSPRAAPASGGSQSRSRRGDRRRMRGGVRRGRVLHARARVTRAPRQKRTPAPRLTA